MSFGRRSRRGLTRVAVLAVIGALGAGCTPEGPVPVPVPPGFTLTPLIKGLDHPTTVRLAPDGRLFVAEKGGKVKVFDDAEDTAPDVLVDLAPAVYDYWDHGLLGLAVDPAFPARPYVYVLYALDETNRWGDNCPDPPGANTDGCVVDGRLSRLQVGPGNTLVGTEKVLLDRRWCSQYPSHGLGSLAFGGDGALYLSAGDGADFNGVDYGQFGGGPGSPTVANPCGDPPGAAGTRLAPPKAEGGALRSQDLLSASDPLGYNGTVLRLDPDTGAARAGNPLIGTNPPEAGRIIAHGLRNPFRLAARPGTDEIWVADVGWNVDEELNRIPDPADGVVENFGWPCFEGASHQAGYEAAGLDLCNRLYAGTPGPSSLTSPYYSYRHDAPPDTARCGAGGASVSGVAFYPGGNYPGVYDGALFFADYTRRCVWAMLRGTDGEPDPGTIVTVATNADVVHLEPGPGGDLLMVDLLGGTIYRLGYFSDDRPPTASFTATPPNGALPLTVAFDASRSSDPEGGALRFDWDLDGDGAFDDASGPRADRTYTVAGKVDVRLRVTDAAGATATTSVEVQPGNRPPVADITGPDPAQRWAVGEPITFAATGSDPDQASLPASAYSWQLTIHHCSSPTDCHEHPLQRFTGPTGSFSAPDHEYPSHLTLDLTVTDAGGLTAKRTVRLDPRTVNLTFTSDPPGLQLALGDARLTTPFTREVIVGSINSVSAPSPQTVPAGTFAFGSWADGGPASRSITAPAGAATYTVRYDLTAPSPPGGTSWVSDLPWVSATNGWGPPSRDRSNGEKGDVDGNRLTVGGVGHDKGIGVHAPSEIHVALNGRCSSFEAVVGIDDEVGELGSVAFIVRVDGTVGYYSGLVLGNDAPASVRVPTTGAQELVLQVVDAEGSAFDHADWASARVTCG
jgi:glucose/arabinose dehydrogenase